MCQKKLLFFLFLFISCANEPAIKTTKAPKVIIEDTMMQVKDIQVEPKKEKVKSHKEEEISYCEKLTNEDLQGLTLKDIGLLRVTAVISESSNNYLHISNGYEKEEVDKRAVDLQFYSCEDREFRIKGASSSPHKAMFYSRYNEHKHANKFVPEFNDLVFFNFTGGDSRNIETFWRKENDKYFYLGTIGTYLNFGLFSSSGIDRIFETTSEDKIIVGRGGGGDGGHGSAVIWFARWKIGQPAQMLKMITYEGEYDYEMTNGIEYSFNAKDETVTLFPKTEAFRKSLKEKTFSLK